MRKLKNEELNRKSVEEFKIAEKNNLVLVLDNVRSLLNVGSAFRTADAFLVERIYLCGITGTPPHREIQKTALGATESVDWTYGKDAFDAVQELKKSGYKILVIEQADQSISLEDFKPDPKSKFAMVFGNEVSGVDDRILHAANEVIEIPQFGTKHSLNISVSIGIVIWTMFCRLKKLN
jgi:tRNA G18 (ribose-2'-O)-methylase SpoU